MIEINKLKNIKKCQLNTCQNTALYEIKIKINKYLKNDLKNNFNHIYICEKCLAELYKKLGEKIIPKSIKSAFSPSFFQIHNKKENK